MLKSLPLPFAVSRVFAADTPAGWSMTMILPHRMTYGLLVVLFVIIYGTYRVSVNVSSLTVVFLLFSVAQSVAAQTFRCLLNSITRTVTKHIA